MMELTELENRVLGAIVSTAIEDTGGQFTSFQSLNLNELSLTKPQLKGVISSLKKKGYINVDSDYFSQINPTNYDESFRGIEYKRALRRLTRG